MDTKILTQVGLTDSEIKVYFALLELEASSVGPILDKSKVPNSKIYMLLDRLKKKGLVSVVIKNNVKHFQASDPKNLIGLLNEKEDEIRKQKDSIKNDVIPYIENKRKNSETQEATVYESFEGLKSAFNLIIENLNKGEEYQVFMLGEELGDKSIVRFFQNFHAKRIEKGIKVRFICNKDAKTLINKHHKYKLMRIKYTIQKYPVGTFIFKGNVMTIVFGKIPTAFVIKSSKNYEQYKEYFEDVWNNIK